MRPDVPSINISRRGKIVIGVLVSLFVILSAVGSLANTYTEWLWFGEARYRGVFTSILWTRLILFLVFGLLMAVTIGVNIWVAYRMRPPFRPISQEQENLERYRVAIEPQKKWIFVGILAVSWFAAGMAAQQNWRTWQLFRFGGSFGVKDPQFHRDISFFAWDYPTYRLLLGFGFNAVIFALLLSLAVHYIFGAMRIATPGPKLTISARRHVTVLIFLFIVLKAISYWLDRYGLVFSARGTITGGYTNINAALPAKTILFWVAVLIAIAVLASLWLQSTQIAGISFAVLLILSIGINGIYPALVQSVSVKPNAIDKEAPYIARNIEATRAAYNITSQKDGGPVNYVDYDEETPKPASDLGKDTATIGNIRLTDPSVVAPVFANVQALRSYYGFPAKLDIDRYVVNGVKSDYIVGVRELDESNLTASNNQTTWISKHTVYTHGYGLVAAKADTDLTDTSSFAMRDIPVSGPLTSVAKLDKPQVYYGELGVDYSIVGAPGERELDANDSKSSYQGTGGIKLSFLNRIAFALKYRQTNFLLNDAVSAKGAKIIFDRDPRKRVQKVAPFLQVDSDPYPSIVDGRIVWIIDAYTTMANYPYSDRRSLGNLTADSLSTSRKIAAQPNSQINYIRNSVKATVDAYDGNVNLYAWDEQDPVLKAWRKVFPSVIKDKSQMPAGVLDHVRYPTDMFEVQRALLEQYHVDDTKTFYAGTDRWTVPSDPTTSIGADQPPYYVLAGSNAGTGPAEYQLTSAMKANNRTIMAAYITVNSENGPDYGKITVLKLPSQTSIQGPEQVFNNFNTQDVISKDITQFSGTGSTVVHGNLLSLPIGNTFLYVEPLYIQGQGNQSFPRLQRVIVAYGQKIGYGYTLSSALRNLSQEIVGQGIGQPGSSSTAPVETETPTPTSTSTSRPSGTVTPSATPSDVAAILSDLDAAFAELQDAYKTGDFAKIGAAQAKVQRLTEAYLKARSSAPATSAPTSKSASSPTASPSGS